MDGILPPTLEIVHEETTSRIGALDPKQPPDGKAPTSALATVTAVMGHAQEAQSSQCMDRYGLLLTWDRLSVLSAIGW